MSKTLNLQTAPPATPRTQPLRRYPAADCSGRPTAPLLSCTISVFLTAMAMGDVLYTLLFLAYCRRTAALRADGADD